MQRTQSFTDRQGYPEKASTGKVKVEKDMSMVRDSGNGNPLFKALGAKMRTLPETSHPMSQRKTPVLRGARYTPQFEFGRMAKPSTKATSYTPSTVGPRAGQNAVGKNKNRSGDNPLGSYLGRKGTNVNGNPPNRSGSNALGNPSNRMGGNPLGNKKPAAGGWLQKQKNVQKGHNNAWS